jgi:hypothetical protein
VLQNFVRHHGSNQLCCCVCRPTPYLFSHGPDTSRLRDSLVEPGCYPQTTREYQSPPPPGMPTKLHHLSSFLMKKKDYTILLSMIPNIYYTPFRWTLRPYIHLPPSPPPASHFRHNCWAWKCFICGEMKTEWSPRQFLFAKRFDLIVMCQSNIRMLWSISVPMVHIAYGKQVPSWCRHAGIIQARPQAHCFVCCLYHLCGTFLLQDFAQFQDTVEAHLPGWLHSSTLNMHHPQQRQTSYCLPTVQKLPQLKWHSKSNSSKPSSGLLTCHHQIVTRLASYFTTIGMYKKPSLQPKTIAQQKQFNIPYLSL